MVLKTIKKRMEKKKVGISLCHETFINSSALIVSLMALRCARGPKHLLALFYLSATCNSMKWYHEHTAK